MPPTMPPLSNARDASFGGADSHRCGGCSRAPASSQEQMVSSVFSMHPAVQEHSRDDHLQVKPHQAQFTPSPRVTPRQAAAAPPPPVAVPETPALAPAPPAETVEAQEREAEAVLEKLRGGLRKRGAVGMTGLARNFRICDTDGSDKLSEDQARDLVAQLEPDREGLVNYAEYVNMMMSD